MPPSISFPQPAPDPVQHSFAQAPVADIERSTFSLSHAIKLTCDCSYLIPFYTDEILPSETRSAQFQFFGRLGTPLYAPMDNLYVDTFFFSCRTGYCGTTGPSCAVNSGTLAILSPIPRLRW